MKPVLGILTLAALTMGAAKGSPKGFMGWGIGGGLSLAVPDDGWSFRYWDDWIVDYDKWGNPIYADNYYWNNYWYGCTGVGPGAELKAVIRFGIGKGGSIHYVPGISWWGRWEDVGNQNSTDVKLHDHEFNLNFFDARYVPPIPRTCPVKPYVGLGLLGFNLYTWREKNVNGTFKHSDTDFQLHQNFFAGAEFELKGKLWPYVEFKLSNGAVDDFQMTAGFTIQGKK